MNEEQQDAFNAEAQIEHRESRRRFKVVPQERRWSNATIEAERSNRMAIEQELEVEFHRRNEEYAS